MAKSCLLACVLSLCAVSPLHPQAASQLPSPQVDQRVELLSIVFRLAGNPEYNMDTLPEYSGDIDRYFAPYKNHPAVKMARKLAEKQGLHFDAVMSMAISISQPPELKPLVPFSATIPEQRWGSESENFLALLRDFYRDSKFAEFYAAHAPMYKIAEDRFAAILRSVNFDWYSQFYGSAPGLKYHVVLGFNNGGGNYGPRLVYPDGRSELFSIVGCWTHDNVGTPIFPDGQGYRSIIVHEFNHSFVNPAVAAHWKEFGGAEPVFQAVAGKMQRMAYGNAQTMVDESLVRAGVILYFQSAGEDPHRNLLRIREEQRNGFVWMDELVGRLKTYEQERAKYPTFASYMPQIAAFYRDLAPRVPALLAAMDAQSANVVKIEPFANHAQDVDPSIKEITISFDKPLATNAYSISMGEGAREHYPISGAPAFDEGGSRIKVPVRLKPGQTYTFVLTPNAFATPDGYPLVSYTVEFKTK